MTTKNIVLFGQSGAGKSSIINLMAGEEKAKTSPSMVHSTMHWKEYSINFDGYSYKVFETVGLQEPQLGMKKYLNIIANAHNLVAKLKQEGGIDLLLFCVRAGRFTSTIQNHYRLFHEWLCEKVPIVLVLTGLEREQNMEDCWTKYNDTLSKYGIVVDGHACITAANRLDGRHRVLYEESRRLVRNLVIQHSHDRQVVLRKEGSEGSNEGEGDAGWYTRFTRGLRVMLLRQDTPKKKNMVTVLTRRCGMPREAAVQLARQIKHNLGQKSPT